MMTKKKKKYEEIAIPNVFLKHIYIYINWNWKR